MKIIRTIFLSVKYWMQGDRWRVAYEYAKALVYGFKR